MVEQLYAMYRDPEADTLFERPVRQKCYDYIRNPKPDGYRGIHIVGRYEARAKKNEPWNGQRIEIQLRSQLQHAFATAVELKFGAGPDEWQRFFSLVGSAFACREETSLVPGTPSDHNELVKELRELTKQLSVRRRLHDWADAIKQLPKENVGTYKWLLLVLNLESNEIRVIGFAERRQASRELERIEKGRPDAKKVDAVMVWVKSVYELRSAYPNYYADTSKFVEALDLAIT